MWTLAAALSSQFHHLRDTLYRDTLENLARSPTEDDASCLEHTQAWILVAVYEFMQAPFQRAWISAGRAIRLVQLMRLNEIDKGTDHEMNTEAFIENEEKRRTFWMAFCLDRCSCVLEGLSLTLNEQEVCRLDGWTAGLRMKLRLANFRYPHACLAPKSLSRVEHELRCRSFRKS